jgi:hypothetical protein
VKGFWHLALVALFLAACRAEKAPVMKRVLHDDPIDRQYLHEVFIPHQVSEDELRRAVAQLESHIAEFQSFMRDVETGQIPVVKGVKEDWGSFVQDRDSWTSAAYSGRIGPVIDFQKHQNKNPAPMIFHFEFNASGYISRADMPDAGFNFDFMGRPESYHIAK